MLEFSRAKNTKTLGLIKDPFSICKKGQSYFFLRRKQNSPISSHGIPTLCKECNHATCTGDKCVESITQLMLCWAVNILKLQSFVAWVVEMNLTWNLTGTERLTLYCDSVEELGRLACFKCLFSASSRSDFRIEYVAFALQEYPTTFLTNLFIQCCNH